ncbi:hypothetical protein HK097_003288 [Rhizophlyctis rosea]|uniref:Uncharacterized protein n=1 Tax=Rhizophlyctis rosea TaxID=64517 RepID=A0AAD5SEZ4_9FUNG|nr:hypothetical protein HK097_003288 [Rhizophlyctis rosea]
MSFLQRPWDRLVVRTIPGSSIGDPPKLGPKVPHSTTPTNPPVLPAATDSNPFKRLPAELITTIFSAVSEDFLQEIQTGDYKELILVDKLFNRALRPCGKTLARIHAAFFSGQLYLLRHGERHIIQDYHLATPFWKNPYFDIPKHIFFFLFAAYPEEETDPSGVLFLVEKLIPILSFTHSPNRPVQIKSGNITASSTKYHECSPGATPTILKPDAWRVKILQDPKIVVTGHLSEEDSWKNSFEQEDPDEKLLYAFEIPSATDTKIGLLSTEGFLML